MKEARVAVDTMINGYVRKHEGLNETYTDLHDNALRQVLYNLMERVMYLEQSSPASMLIQR